jgi:hypothetical protein
VDVIYLLIMSDIVKEFKSKEELKDVDVVQREK